MQQDRQQAEVRPGRDRIKRSGIGFGQYRPYRWFILGAAGLLVIVVYSTLIYWSLGQHYGRSDWTLMDCLFMVVITLTTIGYGDWLSIRGLLLVEWYTLFLAVVAMAVPALVITNLTAMIVEGVFNDAFRRRAMGRQIAVMKDHFIICGIGTTGYHCLDELLRTRRPCVVIDPNRDKLEQVTADLGEFPFIIGSPDSDDVLRQAGVERARGLVASLADDKENLYVTLSARALNPDLRIISEVRDNLARPKLIKAGANSVVNPTAIGGLRMVSELVRPAVVTFLDSMLRDRHEDYRFEELLVAPGCAVDGKTLGASELAQKADVLIVALQLPGDARFTYHPKPETVLPAGATVVLMGRIEEIVKLRPDFSLPE